MNSKLLDAIIIGAGHSGLSASYFLRQFGLQHIVIERGRIGESWRSQRWDSFTLNTPNGMNLLPGVDYTGDDPEGFCPSGDFVSFLEAYTAKFHLPVVKQSLVVSLQKPERESYFTVNVSENGVFKEYKAWQVIICSGDQNKRKTPSFAEKLPPGFVQLHTGEYRNGSQLPDGAILVVGSGQSGCQITEDLLQSGRKVFLSSSLVARIPRRYRGKDLMDWLMMLGFFDLETEHVNDPKVFAMKAPLLSGIGKHGHTLSLQYLGGKGAVILGSMENADDLQIYFKPNAIGNLKFGDEFSKKVKDMIDDFILKNQLAAIPPEDDPADMPGMDASFISPGTSLNLKGNNIKSIIWTTGFSADFDYIKLPVLGNNLKPEHRNGISGVDGLYFLGIHWLRSRKSGLIAGIKNDAEFIAEKVSEYSRQKHENKYNLPIL